MIPQSWIGGGGGAWVERSECWALLGPALFSASRGGTHTLSSCLNGPGNLGYYLMKKRKNITSKLLTQDFPGCLVVKTVSTSRGMGLAPGRRNLTCLASWSKK